MIAIFLALSVASFWLAAWGLLRLSSAYDRLHCVTFAAIAGGLPVLIATFIAQGASAAAFKVLLIFVLNVGCGAALTHATGRAIAFREAGGAE